MSADDRDWTGELHEAKEEMKRMAAEQVMTAREQLRAERRERGSRRPRGRDNVVSCRLDGTTLEAVDTLVEAGVRATRADAVTWLIEVGLEANRELIEELAGTVAEIRRLRQDAASKAQRRVGEPPTPVEGQPEASA